MSFPASGDGAEPVNPTTGSGGGGVPDPTASQQPPEPGLIPPADSGPAAPEVRSPAARQPDPRLEREARKRVKAKQSVKQLTGVFLIVWAILIAVWWLSGGGYFWPAWAILGMGIGLAFAWWGAYGPREDVSDAAVDKEMRRMQGGG